MIWLLAGTAEGREIAVRLRARGYPLIATTVTSYGAHLLSSRGVEARAVKLDGRGMIDFILREGIDRIVDATHPFAEEASINARSAAEALGIKYIRFERPGTFSRENGVIRASTYEQAAAASVGYGSTVFLTIGVNHLDLFVRQARESNVDLVARVLATPGTLERCKALGLTENEIISGRGSFGLDENVAQFRAVGASVVVTKETGKVGGFDEKLKAAGKLGIPVVVIERPPVPDDAVNDYDSLIERLMGA